MQTTELHDRLDRLAERTAPEPQDAAHLVRTVAARSRAQRRQRVGVGAVALAVAAVVAVVPALLSGRADHGNPAGPTTASPLTAGSTAVLDAPTRGNLAGDAAFVESVRQLPWTEADDPDAPTAQAEPPVETRHVVFVGDVPGGRWALVAGDEAGAPGETAMWFAGPAGAAAEQLQPVQLAGGLDAGAPVALTDAGSGTLVVLAAPGDAVEVSQRPDVSADGTVSRGWRSADAEDGVAVTAVAPVATFSDEAVRYRVIRDGARLVTAMPPSFRAGDYDPPSMSTTWLRGSADSNTSAALAGPSADILTRLGLSPGDVQFSVVWSGELPGADGTTLTLLTATLPSGATYTEGRLTRQTAHGVQAGAVCGSELRPAGTPLAGQTFAVRCDDLGVLAVVGPATAGAAWALDDHGQQLTQFDLDDGVALVPAPPGAVTVATRSGDGATQYFPVMGSVDLSRK